VPLLRAELALPKRLPLLNIVYDIQPVDLLSTAFMGRPNAIWRGVQDVETADGPPLHGLQQSRMRNMSVWNMRAGERGEASSWDPSVLSRKPFNEQILPFIRRDIIMGRWKPNERLSEPMLCREFGVSRTPLRDAFKVLESEGLIALVPHVGAVITDPTIPDMGEKLEVLISLEQFAAFKLALLRPAAALEEITTCHNTMIEAARTADAAKYYRMNDDFHRAIVLGTGNKTLSEAHERVMWHIHRARHLANEHEPLSENAASHHQRIVDAIVSGNSRAAEEAIRDHLVEVAAIITGRPDAVLTQEPPGGSKISSARGSGKSRELE
jgi:DNA-binding GntR family transcriptional regulator